MKARPLNTALGKHVNVCVGCCSFSKEWVVQHVMDANNTDSLITYVSKIEKFYDTLTGLKKEDPMTRNWKILCTMEMMKSLLLYGFCRLEDLYCFYSEYKKLYKSKAAEELVQFFLTLNISDILLLAVNLYIKTKVLSTLSI